MNCAYHSHNGATVNCNGCGKPLCPACDHRIKGFPYCQDCIVLGVDLLRSHYQSSNSSYVKSQTSPFAALVYRLSVPGLGAAYNGQTYKALIHFAISIGLFQLAILAGMPIFVFGVLGMWLYSMVDAWKTARLIRSGAKPDLAEDILVQRFRAIRNSGEFYCYFSAARFYCKCFRFASSDARTTADFPDRSGTLYFEKLHFQVRYKHFK